MSGFAVPISVAVQRRNPVRIPRRDFVIAGSDTPTLALTVYQSESDTAPLDISDASFALTLFQNRDDHLRCWDYGFPHIESLWQVAQFSGIPMDPAHGRVDIPINEAFMRKYWHVSRRFWAFLTISYQTAPTTGIGLIVQPDNQDYAQGNMTIMQGFMDFIRGPCIPQTQAPDLMANIGRPA